MPRWRVAPCVALMWVAFVGCSDDSTSTPDEAPPEPVPGRDWEVQSPEEQGLDPALLDEARTYAFSPGMNTQAVVVVHGGVIVAEWYAEVADKDSWAASWSVAKSFTSALIGIAIADGLIPSVDEPMITYYPDWKGTEREAMTLRDVLQMSSGLDWVEDYDPAAIFESDIIQLVLGEEDQLRYPSARPAKVEPGSAWNYSSGDTMLLSGVLEQATGHAG
jgi:CubicO group peptidase (beta-lactamase class C family)